MHTQGSEAAVLPPFSLRLRRLEDSWGGAGFAVEKVTAARARDSSDKSDNPHDSSEHSFFNERDEGSSSAPSRT